MIAHNLRSLSCARASYLDESYEFSMELDGINDGVRDLQKLSSVCNLKDLRKIGYYLRVFGYYWNVCPSMLKRVLQNCGFKIAKTRVVAESKGTNEVNNKLKKVIDSLSLDESFRENLAEVLRDLKK